MTARNPRAVAASTQGRYRTAPPGVPWWNTSGVAPSGPSTRTSSRRPSPSSTYMCCTLFFVTTAELYREFGEREARGESPTYERLSLAVADDRGLLALIDTLPEPKRQPNLLYAAARYLGGPVDPPSAFSRWALAHWPSLAATMRERRTQTNEPGRCASLLPVLARLPQPLALLEVGASAGLCLY